MASTVFNGVCFAYDASTDGLLADVSFSLSEGWTGVIGANGTGKSTLLRLACGDPEPKAGVLDRPASALYCPQRTDEPMAASAAFLDAVDGEAYRIRGPLGIEDDWLDRWEGDAQSRRAKARPDRYGSLACTGASGRRRADEPPRSSCPSDGRRPAAHLSWDRSSRQPRSRSPR